MRTGRPPEEGRTRTAVICIRLGDADERRLDEKRGTLDRSAYIRQLIREAK